MKCLSLKLRKNESKNDTYKIIPTSLILSVLERV